LSQPRFGFTAWWLAPVLVWLALVLPAHPDKFNLQSLLALPLELPLVILAVLLLPAVLNRAFRVVLVVFLLALVLLRLADVGSYIAFDRGFSPLVEWHLLGDGWNLASSTVGRGQAARPDRVCQSTRRGSGAGRQYACVRSYR